MRRIPSSGFLEPLSPSRGAFSPVSSVSWDPTQALVRRSQSVGPETLQAPPSPRTLLDDLLVTHTQLEVQSHAALALEDVAELKATRAHLEERLADLVLVGVGRQTRDLERGVDPRAVPALLGRGIAHASSSASASSTAGTARCSWSTL